MEIYEKLGDWLVPAFLGMAIVQLQNIATEIKKISVSLAVAVTRVDAHEQRLKELETEIGVIREGQRGA